MIFHFNFKHCKITVDLKHKYNLKTDRHKFDFQSIHVDDIFYPDVEDVLILLDIDIVDFSKLIIEEFFKQN